MELEASEVLPKDYIDRFSKLWPTPLLARRIMCNPTFDIDIFMEYEL